MIDADVRGLVDRGIGLDDGSDDDSDVAGAQRPGGRG